MADRYDDMLKGCPLADWDGDPNTCRWCAAPLRARRRTWCSPACMDAFRAQHIWSQARPAVIARDGSCVHADRGRCAGPLEVNHQEPLWGAGYGPSCLHHHTNLEALCQRHHRQETRRWAQVRQAFILRFALDIGTGRPASLAGWRPLRERTAA